jgi:biotin carboxyl carrier protein
MNIKVKPGDPIKRGDVLLILEAMKMENEILAAQDATVAAVHVSQGSSVNTGDNLISLS